MIQPKILAEKTTDYRYVYSICTIVNDFEEYQLMKNSFEQCGFTDGCEYIVADNSNGNCFDAYQAIKSFLQQSQAKYLIAVHQDVRCIDNRKQLEKCIDELFITDQYWGICGNAGSHGYHESVMYITNAGKISKSHRLPAKVNSLDENLLIINKASNITVSANKGFHLYGTDLCIVAGILGYNCYVIRFMVEHLSLGDLKKLDKHVNKFIRGYGVKFRSRYIETTCTRFYLGNSLLKSRVLNFLPVFSVIKTIQGIRYLYKLLRYGNVFKKSVRFDASRSFKQAGR